VGGYAQVHEIGIDPVKLRQLPRDFAAAFDVLAQAFRQSAQPSLDAGGQRPRAQPIASRGRPARRWR
jgi:hypothetical protein